MIGKTSKVYSEIRSNTHILLNGIIFCVDPSIGSTSSQPGWAVYNRGELVAADTLSIDPHGSIPVRLQELRRLLKNLYHKYEPDVLVYEDIPAQRQGGGNAVAHASLLKAVGAILSVPGPREFVGILPISWKKMVRPEYIKGDMEDAIEIGWIVLQEAARILEVDPPTKGYRRGA